MILFGRIIGIIGFAWYLLPLDFFSFFFLYLQGKWQCCFCIVLGVLVFCIS